MRSVPKKNKWREKRQSAFLSIFACLFQEPLTVDGIQQIGI